MRDHEQEIITGTAASLLSIANALGRGGHEYTFTNVRQGNKSVAAIAVPSAVISNFKITHIEVAA